MKKLLLLLLLVAPFFRMANAQAQQGERPLEDSRKEIMKITDQGLVPPAMSFDKLDSTVFFVNATNDSLVTLKVNFGDREGHCASPNMKFDSGVMRSTQPIGPKDFALMCFPLSGTYDVTVEGVGKRPPLTGKVIIQ